MPLTGGPSGAASRKSGSPAVHEARSLLGAGACISRIRLFVKPVCVVSSKKKKTMRFLATSSVSPRYLQSRLQCWTDLEAHAFWRSSSEWMREWRQQKWSTPRFSMAADQVRGPQWLGGHARCSAFCAPVTSALESSLRRTTAECVGGSDDLAPGDGELAAARKGTSWLREPSKRAAWIRAPARCVAPDRRDTRVRSEGQWPRFGLGVALAGSLRPHRWARHPLVTRRSLSSHRLAQGRGRARDGKEADEGVHWKGNAKPDDDDSLQKQIRAAVK